MMVGLAPMLLKGHEGGGEALRGQHEPGEEQIPLDLGKVDAQIRLIQSVLYNVPFAVGANLFWMGLPGTGSPVTKAWLDCYFLLGTVVLFSGFYILNQQTVRKQLLPL